MHASCSFVTLTYSDEKLPPGGTLVLKDYQDWLKRYRKQLSPHKIRFFVVGEYGETTQRPHYHFAIFGGQPCLYAPGPTKADIFRRRTCPCPPCSVVRSTWGKGHTDNGTLTKDSAQYICGYVTKKMTAPDDPRLNGRYPEFAKMSLRPGIGGLAVPTILDALTTSAGCKAMEKEGDVPRSLMHAGKSMPLGRYLRRKIREAYGIEDGKAPPEVVQKFLEEMRGLFKDVKQAPGYQKGYAPASVRLQAEYVKVNQQGIWNVESRSKLYRKKGSV